MDKEHMGILEQLASGIVFRNKHNVCDALLLLNWVQDHKSIKVYKHRNNFVMLCYCGRCSTIVAEGDKYCSQCGRELRWE